MNGPEPIDDEVLTVPILVLPKIVELPPKLLAEIDNEIDRDMMQTVHRMAQQLDWLCPALVTLQNTYVRRIERTGKRTAQWKEWVSSKWAVIAFIAYPVLLWGVPKLLEKLFK